MNTTCNVTIRFGGGNYVRRTVPVGTPLSTIINDPNVKAQLGYGSNVQALIDRRHVQPTYQIGSDLEVVLETVANSKAAGLINVTIKFGGGNEIGRQVSDTTTVGDILNDRSILAALGVGGNVQALINRVVQEPGTPLESGDVIVLETVANAKAA